MCGQAMQPGYVVTGSTGLYWLTADNEIPTSPDLLAQVGAQTILSFRHFDVPRIPGQICRKCKLVVGRYEGWPQPEGDEE